MRIVDIDNLKCFIDLHVHVDGSISLENAKDLIRINQKYTNLCDEEILKRMQKDPNCHSLNDFLSKFDFAISLLQKEEAIEACFFNLCSALKEEGVMYAELRFAPCLSCKEGLSQKEVVEAALRGLKRSTFNGQLILCAMRGEDIQTNKETADLVKEFELKGVCALDLAGAEAIFKTKDFEALFDYAKSLNIKFTIHAGEADGIDSICSALEFGTLRIGHGIRACENKELIENLAKRGIPLELCVTSNLDTCIFDRYDEYPLRKLMNEGVVVTINSDDQAVSRTNIKKEWKEIINHFKLSTNEVRRLLMNSAMAAFIDSNARKYLVSQINREFEEMTNKMNLSDEELEKVSGGSLTDVVFPCRVKCPSCSQEFLMFSPGTKNCFKCHSNFDVDENGNAKLQEDEMARSN